MAYQIMRATSNVSTCDNRAQLGPITDYDQQANHRHQPVMPSPTFEVQSYRGITLGWVAVGQRYYSQAMAERLLAIRCRVDPWRYCYRVAQIG